MSTEASAAGGWSTYSCNISEEAKKAFAQAMKDFVGVAYTPVAVAQQLVAGMNYRFFCNATPAVEYPFPFAAIVTVFQPLEGKAVLTGIHPIHM